MNKRIVPLWEVSTAFYHYSDKERAEYHTGEKAKLKWVILDSDFFITTWQLKNQFDYVAFDTEAEAKSYLNSLVTT